MDRLDLDNNDDLNMSKNYLQSHSTALIMLTFVFIEALTLINNCYCYDIIFMILLYSTIFKRCKQLLYL